MVNVFTEYVDGKDIKKHDQTSPYDSEHTRGVLVCSIGHLHSWTFNLEDYPS